MEVHSRPSRQRLQGFRYIGLTLIPPMPGPNYCKGNLETQGISRYIPCSCTHLHADFRNLRTTAPIMSRPRMLMMRFTVLHHLAFCHRFSSTETSDGTMLFGYAWLPYSDICAVLGNASGLAYAGGRLGRDRNAARIHTSTL